jgi:hypothetical protein
VRGDALACRGHPYMFLIGNKAILKGFNMSNS